MKNLILVLLVVAILSNACKKSDSLKAIDGCPVSSFINANYLNDAKEIVYRRILSGNQVLNSNQPEFSQLELDRVLSAIESVHALQTAQTDSIFNIIQIHTFKHYVLNSIILKVNLNAPEIQNFINQKPTGNQAFDGLLAKYGFAYNDSSPPSAILPYLDIKSNNWYNIQGLTPYFNQFPFIQNAEGDGTVGDGNDMTYTLNGTKRTINFSIGFGDCPAGCGGRKTWEFSVDENCRANFVKTYQVN
jgi:hypothetical protein